MSKAKDQKKGKQDKKPEEKPKVNFEELIIANLSNPQITFDYTGYQFTELDISFLNASKNKITELPGIKAPNLLHLILNENSIDKAEGFEGHPKLRKLELRSNKIVNTAQLINMPELKELYLSNNKIKSILGFDLQNLVVLHLRQNNIEVFEETFPNMENLQYLNLRENKFQNLEEFSKLAGLPNLRTLIHSFNPLIQKNPMYLYDTINMLLKLTRINKQHITKNVKLKAFKYAEDKYNQQMEAKKKAEEEEKRKQELAEQQQQQGGDDQQ